MNYLLFSGSLRSGSYNKKLVAVVHSILAGNPAANIKIADIRSLSIPVYDGDVEAVGIPEGVKELGKMIQEADALIISSPEYNGSIAGVLKNTIDWVSRLRPVPLERKPILLMGASPGYFGSIRALGFTRAPFETLGSYLYPQSFALPKAGDAFTPTGDLVDEGTKKRLSGILDSFAQFAEKLK